MLRTAGRAKHSYFPGFYQMASFFISFTYVSILPFPRSREVMTLFLMDGNLDTFRVATAFHDLNGG